MAALIAYLSLVPSDARAVRWMPAWLQKAGHVGCYALLALLCFFALASVPGSPLAHGAIVFASATGFGVLMEWLQRGVPGRHASLRDAAQDAIGVLIGIFIAVVLRA